MAVYFYESCSILASLQGKPKHKGQVKIYSSTTGLSVYNKLFVTNCFDREICKHI